MSLRQLPAVHAVVAAARKARPDLPAERLTAAARAELATLRAALVRDPDGAVPALEAIVAAAIAAADSAARPSLRAAINASGVIIQTNLGRAPLSAAARAAMSEVAAGYSNLEYDLERGERGSRSTHLAGPLTRLSGAEAALVVNNAAAALLLTLSGLAAGREVVVSRGQAVEIGGGFRIPEIILQSGCRLVDVGTTNRTYAADYAAALTPQTAAFLRVHSSNFRLVGFVREPGTGELAEAASAAGVLMIEDLGSGALLDTARWGLAPEPTVQAAVRAGADIVIFSGDKLLGGPQAGVIVGRAAPLAMLARHPLMRALRVDKTTIAGLAATLAAYEAGRAADEIPIWRMISASRAELLARAERMAAALDRRPEIVESVCAVGGGALPGATLPSIALQLAPEHPDAFVAALRGGDPPVVARINEGRVLCDLRSVLPEQDASLIQALNAGW